MSDYYDRKGNPMEMMDWAMSMEKDRRVGLDKLPNGYKVSTVWLGLNHQYGNGKPLIFETMVFHETTGGRDHDCERYSTEQEAVEGHKAMVEKWLKEDRPKGE